MLTDLHTDKRRWPLRMLAAVSLVWLNLVVSPCAMALGEPDEHDCPHCPPAEHCEEQVAKSCRYLDNIDSDGRTHQTRTPDFFDYAFSLPPELAPAPLLSVDAASVTVFLQTTGPPDPPLYIRHCAYLD